MKENREITRRSVLEDALERETITLKSCSQSALATLPIKGFEKEFAEQQEKCRLLREMIQAHDSEIVRSAMAKWLGHDEKGAEAPKEWQTEVMNGGKQISLFEPGT